MRIWPLIVVVFIGCICAFEACKKKDEYYYVDKGVIGWFQFPDNSYWVFVDSASHFTDSLAWKGGTSSTAVLSAHRYSESYNLYCYEYLNGATRDTAVWELLLANDGSASRVILSMFLEPTGPNNQVTDYNPLYSLPLINNYFNSHTGKYNDITYIGTATINNKSYDSVYHARFFASGSSSDEHIYFNRKVGFLKFVQHSLSFNRTLELERWFVPR